ncbi:hypothetical protein QG071_05545 [Kingella kingae]|uniref:hypothetical protein n=1 Tax=Kingella kingae TaxID=504 RepID=UPI0012BB779A|nr:hypothetical protein [Kingella kingae]MDK4555512.1 hypothetical protein [Kingella kingae]MDK4584590.1 hypothetical protein [Kingella kingae]MDK4588575.1 hypothetical protein [Kingella kingae]MDK4610662.1 hypothetical protein [Kingella kingae]MDK4642446.1 hypothetical protein [Kingella kingae]
MITVMVGSGSRPQQSSLHIQSTECAGCFFKSFIAPKAACTFVLQDDVNAAIMPLPNPKL